MTGFVGKLPRKAAVKELASKSIESAVLAVEIYNKPTVQFRSAAYVTLMIIAWTAAFHAVFERSGVVYFHKKKNGRFEKIDGDKKAWELSTCMRQYTGTLLSDDVRANLALFAKLRNKIEHRQMATLDAHIAPECQALLLNLKDFLQSEFEIDLLGDIGLYVPISVFSSTRSMPQSSNEKSLISFIDRYRDSLDPKVWQDTKYAFRAFLIPKVGNHESSSDVTMEFLKLSGLSEAQQEKVTRMATLVREKQMHFKGDLLKPRMVVAKVRERHPAFHMSNFVNAWKTLKVRPESGSEDPGSTDTKYCYYDPVDGDYRYEPAFAKKICEMIDGGHDFSCIRQMVLE